MRCATLRRNTQEGTLDSGSNSIKVTAPRTWVNAVETGNRQLTCHDPQYLSHFGVVISVCGLHTWILIRCTGQTKLPHHAFTKHETPPTRLKESSYAA